MSFEIGDVKPVGNTIWKQNGFFIQEIPLDQLYSGNHSITIDRAGRKTILKLSEVDPINIAMKDIYIKWMFYEKDDRGPYSVGQVVKETESLYFVEVEGMIEIKPVTNERNLHVLKIDKMNGEYMNVYNLFERPPPFLQPDPLSELTWAEDR